MHGTLRTLLDRNAEHADAFDGRFDDVQDAQHPNAVTVCCSDSRVLQDHAWGNDTPGELFTVGNIGNRVVQRTAGGEVVSGDVLYPLVHTGTGLAIVMGHTGCGAVTATYESLTGGLSDRPGIEHCVDVLAERLEPALDVLPNDLDDAAAVNHLVEYNVDRQVEALLASEDVPEDVDVVGVVYDFQDVYSGSRGEVHVVNVAGERDPATLREEYPEVADRIERRWNY